MVVLVTVDVPCGKGREEAVTSVGGGHLAYETVTRAVGVTPFVHITSIIRLVVIPVVPTVRAEKRIIPHFSRLGGPPISLETLPVGLV